MAEDRGRRALIVHGYESNPGRNWFGWLRGKLEADGYEVALPALPNPDDPRLGAWLDALAAAFPPEAFGPETLVVGHSLGCVTALRYLLRVDPPRPVAGVLLAAGFWQPLSAASSAGLGEDDVRRIDGFVGTSLDFERLRRLARAFVVVSAEDDPIVPHELSRNLATSLGARFVSLPHGGHLMEEDGLTEFPLAYDELRSMM